MRKWNAVVFASLWMLLAAKFGAQTSGVNNLELKGDYAFAFSGFMTEAGASSVLCLRRKIYGGWRRERHER